MEKYYYTVDFSEVKYYSDVYQAVIRGLEFPEYCGENYDALYDFMTDMITQYSVVLIKNFEIVEEKYGDAWSKILECFVDAKHVYHGKYQERLDIILLHKDGKREKIR